MFGRTKRKVTKHTEDAIRPILASYQYSNGIPAGFWQDEFVLGFIGFMISFHVNITSGYKLSTVDKGFLLFDVLTTLSNMNGKLIGKNYTDLAMENPKNEDFEKGADHAAICAFYSIGKINKDADVWIEEAKKITDSNEHSAISGSLLYLLFHQELNERFV